MGKCILADEGDNIRESGTFYRCKLKQAVGLENTACMGMKMADLPESPVLWLYDGNKATGCAGYSENITGLKKLRKELSKLISEMGKAEYPGFTLHGGFDKATDNIRKLLDEKHIKYRFEGNADKDYELVLVTGGGRFFGYNNICKFIGPSKKKKGKSR